MTELCRQVFFLLPLFTKYKYISSIKYPIISYAFKSLEFEKITFSAGKVLRKKKKEKSILIKGQVLYVCVCV